ncbi:MAG: PQQ-binding-like beta-propeller repeat protein, partial [Pirellulales bacterium]
MDSSIYSPGTTNSLSAYDLKTEGHLVWEVDGQTTGGELQGSFFLGAPLAVGQALCSLVEIKSAIYLVVMDSQSGQLLWRQKLANLESGILMSPLRRLQASSPSYDAGILVCPTGAGVVIGVDLAKRSLAWAYRYDNQLRSQQAYHWQPGDADMEASNPGEHWVDHSPILAEGRVLLSPPESKFLHCLELASGKILWKFNRKHYHTLACVAPAPNQGQLETTSLQGTDLPRTDNREVLKNGGPEASLLLLGNSQATALRLRDGKPSWHQSVLRFPAGVQPAGTGFQSHGRYYLPLTSAEVIAIDLAQGTIANRTRSRDGQILGNLICHQGTVLSQNGRSLDRYDQVEMLEQRAEEQLATNQSHAEALRVLGEIAYDRQQLDQAIGLLVRAHQSAPEDLITRDVLGECLLSALDEDFASYREHLGLLTELVDGRNSDHLQLQRIHATGLLSVGEHIESFDVCLQIFQNAFDPTEMLRIGGARQVQVARWVQAQTEAIWNAADNHERALIHQRMTGVLASLKLDSQGLSSLESLTHFRSATGLSLFSSQKISSEMARSEVLHRYLQFFGGLPQSRPWWLQRARALLEDGQLLVAQQILLRLSPKMPRLPETQLPEAHELQNSPGQGEEGDGRSYPPFAEEAFQIENESTARLAQLLHQAGLHRLAREWDLQLTGPLADVVCFHSEQHGDMTGAQCVSHWRALQETSAADPRIFPAAGWPYGKVDVTTTTTKTKRRQVRSPLWGVRLERADPMLASSTILMSSRKEEVVVRNDLGQEFFRAKLQLDGQQAIHYRAPGITYGASHGNLLVVSLGTQLVAFNTLASSGDTRDKVLWRSNLHRTINPNDVRRNYGNERSTSKSARLGSYRAPRLSLGGKWMGVIGPITSKGCVYQDQRHLICCDPISGQILWSRTDVPAGCDLFGDDQYVIASPQSGNTAYVFRMTDGRRVSQGTIPRWKQRLATLGHQIIRWREVAGTPSTSRPVGSAPAEKRMELSCIDALSGNVAWEHTFQNKSRLDIARSRFVAVVEPSGKCSILDARTGQILVHDSLLADPKISEIHLLVATDRFTLLTSHPQPQNNGNRVRGLIPDDCPLISGQVACYDRTTGKPCWKRPADITQQALLLTQPCDLPILLFVNFSQLRDHRGSRPVLSMLILEKASGRTLYRNNNLPNTGGSHLLVSVSKSQTAGQSTDDGQPNNDQAKDSQAEEKSARQASDDPPGTAPIAPAEKRNSHEVTIEMTAKVIH